jgi:hypothetical protein
MSAKRIQLADGTWQALDLFSRDSTKTFQERADESFADLLAKPGRPQRGAASGAGSRPRVACGLREGRKARIFTPVQEPSGKSRLSGAESTMSTTPPFEIPTDMRKVTSQSMEQARTAINGYLHFLQGHIPGNIMGGSELSKKILGYAERNVGSAFEFTQGLVQVRDVQSLAKLQMEFIQAQMQALTEQAKDLSETATKALMDSVKIPTKGGPSS